MYIIVEFEDRFVPRYDNDLKAQSQPRRRQLILTVIASEARQSSLYLYLRLTGWPHFYASFNRMNALPSYDEVHKLDQPRCPLTKHPGWFPKTPRCASLATTSLDRMRLQSKFLCS